MVEGDVADMFRDANHRATKRQAVSEFGANFNEEMDGNYRRATSPRLDRRHGGPNFAAPQRERLNTYHYANDDAKSQKSFLLAPQVRAGPGGDNDSVCESGLENLSSDGHRSYRVPFEFDHNQAQQWRAT